MKKFLKVTEIFAFLWILFFANSILLPAQTANDESIFVIPPGTMLDVRMDNEINSKVSKSEDTFTVTVFKPVTLRGVEILPVGTVIEGRILSVEAASFGRKNGSFKVKFETLKLENGVTRKIDADLFEFKEAKDSDSFGIFAIAGGSAIGALAGALTGGGKNSLIGAGLGAGAGTSLALMKKGREMRIKANEGLKIKFNKEVILPVEDF